MTQKKTKKKSEGGPQQKWYRGLQWRGQKRKRMGDKTWEVNIKIKNSKIQRDTRECKSRKKQWLEKERETPITTEEKKLSFKDKTKS